MYRKIGIQLYTVRDYMGDSDSIRSTFRRLKSIGYDEVQTAGTPSVSYEEFAKIAREENIAIIGTHDDMGLMLNDPEAAMARHRLLGTANMGIGRMARENFTDIKLMSNWIDMANEIGENINPQGFKFTYHNHDNEFHKLGGELILDILVREMNPKTTSFVLDTYWVQRGGGDVRHWIEKLAGRIDIIHLKDMMIGSYCEIGEGNLWWDEIIKLCEDTGVKYLCVEHDNYWRDGDPFKSAKISADFLSKYLGK